MICTKCSNPGTLNTVLNQDFYYCRTCKVEIILETPPPLAQELRDLTPDDEAEFQAWIDEVNAQIDGMYALALTPPGETL